MATIYDLQRKASLQKREKNTPRISPKAVKALNQIYEETKKSFQRMGEAAKSFVEKWAEAMSVFGAGIGHGFQQLAKSVDVTYQDTKELEEKIQEIEARFICKLRNAIADCEAQGYTEPIWVGGRLWAYPPSGVMRVPVEIQGESFALLARLSQYH